MYIAYFIRAIADLILLKDDINEFRHCTEEFLNTEEEKKQLYDLLVKINEKKDILWFLKDEFPTLYYNDRQFPSGNYPLKIEVSSRNSKLLQKNLLNYTKNDNVLVYTVDELIKMKCNTFSQRDKIRDLYDIGFLLKKYPNRFSLDNLKLIYENINYKGMDILSAQLSGEIKKHLLTDIDSDEYLLNILDTCENLIELHIKNNGELNFFKDISSSPNINQALDDELIR